MRGRQSVRDGRPSPRAAPQRGAVVTSPAVTRTDERDGAALRAGILVGLVAFGALVAWRTGLLPAALEGDRSALTWAILLLYVVASARWLYQTRQIARERSRLLALERAAGEGSLALERAGSGVRFGDERWEDGDLARHLGNLAANGSEAHRGSAELHAALTDTIANRHAAGHFVSGVLLRLGLLGTIVGFILMLAPVAGIEELDPARARGLLQLMSGGMAVALYTTLTGLVTSLLLELQMHLLDDAAQDFLNRLAVLVEVHLTSGSAR